MDVGHLAQDPHPLRPIVDGFELGVERPDQLAEVPRPPVDGLEDHGDAVAFPAPGGQPFERRDRIALGGRALQDLGVTIDGRRRVPDLALEDLRETQRHRVALRSLLDPVETRAEQVRQVVPLARRREQAFELGGGDAVLRIDLERLPQRSDCPIPVVETLLVQLGAPPQERAARRRLHRAPCPLVAELPQLAPRAPALQGRLVEMRHLRIVGARVEQTPVVLLRLGPLAELEIEDLGGAPDDLEHRRLLPELAFEVAGEENGDVLPASRACRRGAAAVRG